MAKESSFLSDVFQALRDAGLANDRTTRVVIDIDAGQGVMVHTEQIGDESVINVLRTLDGIKIERKET